MAQPGRDDVDVQAGLQPVAGAAVAQAVGGRTLDAGSGVGRLQSRFRNPLGNPTGRAPWGSGLPLRPVNTLSVGLR